MNPVVNSSFDILLVTSGVTHNCNLEALLFNESDCIDVMWQDFRHSQHRWRLSLIFIRLSMIPCRTAPRYQIVDVAVRGCLGMHGTSTEIRSEHLIRRLRNQEMGSDRNGLLTSSSQSLSIRVSRLKWVLDRLVRAVSCVPIIHTPNSRGLCFDNDFLSRTLRVKT